jgi:hypothetical protein
MFSGKYDTIYGEMVTRNFKQNHFWCQILCQNEHLRIHFNLNFSRHWSKELGAVRNSNDGLGLF